MLEGPRKNGAVNFRLFRTRTGRYQGGTRRIEEAWYSARGRKWGSPKAKDQFSLEIELGIERRKMSVSDAPALGDDRRFGSLTIA